MRSLALMIAVMTFVSVSGAVSAQTLLPDRTTVLIRDTDLPGNDLRPLFETTLTACDAACRADPDCGAFTFNPSNNTCFPKTDADESLSFSGATSGIIRNVSAQALALGEARRADLTFLSDADLTAALDQATTLGLVHYGGLFSAEDWRRSAVNAFTDGNVIGAMRRIGAAITIDDAAADWTTYATYLLTLEGQNNSERRQYEARALSASVNAALRAEGSTDLARRA